MSDRNGAKVRNIREGPAPEGARENLAQGFNSELYTQFVGGNKASLDGVNEYRLEATTVRL